MHIVVRAPNFQLYCISLLYYVSLHLLFKHSMPNSTRRGARGRTPLGDARVDNLRVMFELHKVAE